MRALLSIVLWAVLLVSCETSASLGAGCERNAQCGAPLVCRFGRCRTECAAQRDCPLGTTCLLDQSGSGSCALRDDPDCTSAGHDCAAPLSCVGRACVNVCTLGPECPSGSMCVPIGGGDMRARCVRTDGVDAAIPDAGIVDGDLSMDAPQRDAGPRCTPMGNPDGGPCDTALDIVVGDACSCVRTMRGRVWCWGTSRSLGRDGDTSGCSRINAQDWACPTPSLLRAEDATGAVGAAQDVARLDMQNVSACFVTRAGVISCWGTVDYEAPLGGFATGERARPIQGSTLPLFDRVVVTDGSALAIALDGTTWYGWGVNSGDVLVHGSEMRIPTPTMLSTPPAVTFTTVATGERHACGIDTMGHVRCWGANEHGQSDPSAPGPALVAPTIVPGAITHPTQLVVGVTHSCALADEGFVCWGERQFIYFDGDVASCHTTDVNCRPTAIPTAPLHIAHLFPARNTDDFCASDDHDALYCWGASYGAIASTPTLVPMIGPVASAVISWTHACAITTDSDVWCWGHDESGQLGRGTTAALPTIRAPALVIFP